MPVWHVRSRSNFDDTSRDISEEELNVADADWIFYGVQGGDLAILTNAPLWAQLRGLAANHAVVADDDGLLPQYWPTAAREVLKVLPEHAAAVVDSACLCVPTNRKTALPQ